MMVTPRGFLEHGHAFAKLAAKWHAAEVGLLEAIPRVSPRFEPPCHLAPVVDLLERSRREPVRGLVSVPPRHGKTELISHGLAWLLDVDPRRTHAYVTYAAQVAYSKSRAIRDYARSLGVAIRADAEALHEWRTPERGGLLATGIGGPLTGHGVDGVLVVDDPTKNREEAESAVLREKTFGWFTSVALTRIEPRGSVIVVHTRWHEDDLIGRLAGEEGWEYVNLPAVDPAGMALWPSRWPVDELDKKRRAVGEHDWYSLFQGDPRPRGGRLFGDPARFEAGSSLAGWRIVIGVDPAASEKTHADYTAIVVLAVMGSAEQLVARVLEVVRVQAEIPAVCDRLIELQGRWGAPLVIESAGVGVAVPQMLRRIAPKLHLVEVKPRGDKFVRAQPLAAAWAQGRVLVPLSAPWLGDYLHELGSFTGLGDRHDDQVDATAHAFTYALAGAGTTAIVGRARREMGAGRV